MTLRYVQGDATAPRGDGLRVIAHVCNDAGKWGKGFVLAISRRWQAPEASYRRAFAETPQPALGDVEFVRVAEQLVVANMIGQHGVARRGATGRPPIRYEALRAALARVSEYALEHGASVHMPRIGAGLAGGSWSEIESIIVETLSTKGVTVTVYDYV